MLEADEDLKNWTKRRLELKAEDDARTKTETIREERMLRKAMLEFEWNLRRKMVVEDMEVGDDSMMMIETLTEQLRLLDVWMEDMDTCASVAEDENACLEDEDEHMKDMDILCVRLGVEEMEQEDGHFAWGEEVLAHMEIDNILMEKATEPSTADEKAKDKDCDIRIPDNGLGVGLDDGLGNVLANETAYYQEGTWFQVSGGSKIMIRNVWKMTVDVLPYCQEHC